MCGREYLHCDLNNKYIYVKLFGWAHDDYTIVLCQSNAFESNRLWRCCNRFVVIVTNKSIYARQNQSNKVDTTRQRSKYIHGRRLVSVNKPDLWITQIGARCYLVAANEGSFWSEWKYDKSKRRQEGSVVGIYVWAEIRCGGGWSTELCVLWEVLLTFECGLLEIS